MRDWISELARQHGLLIATVAGYVTIVGISLAPEIYRLHVPGFSDKVEHLVAYFVIGIFTRRIVRSSIPSVTLIALIGGFAAAVELSQALVPSRRASLLDLGASLAGVVAGVMIARRRRTPQA